MTMTLTEFLLARIAEDERAARKLAETDSRPVLSLATTINHPDRLLAECYAKRLLLTGHENEAHTCVYGVPVSDDSDCAAKTALAFPYADHPDYNEDWRL